MLGCRRGGGSLEVLSWASSSSFRFDDLSLLVIYNLAAIYNSPAETPFHSFDDVAAELKQFDCTGSWSVRSGVLAYALQPGRVLQVW